LIETRRQRAGVDFDGLQAIRIDLGKTHEIVRVPEQRRSRQRGDSAVPRYDAVDAVDHDGIFYLRQIGERSPLPGVVAVRMGADPCARGVEKPVTGSGKEGRRATIKRDQRRNRAAVSNRAHSEIAWT